MTEPSVLRIRLHIVYIADYAGSFRYLLDFYPLPSIQYHRLQALPFHRDLFTRQTL